MNFINKDDGGGTETSNIPPSFANRYRRMYEVIEGWGYSCWVRRRDMGRQVGEMGEG